MYNDYFFLEKKKNKKYHFNTANPRMKEHRMKE